MTEGAQTPDPHPDGSFGDEAVKLVEAVQDWIGARTGRGRSDVWAAATTPGAFESPECRVCPICRAMHMVSGLQPDVFAHLANAATALAAAARAMSAPGSNSANVNDFGGADEPSSTR